MKKDKWFYIELVRECYTPNCNIADMLEVYNKLGLMYITDEEAKKYWKHHKPN